MAKKPVIGLLGGGQLGKMLCEAAGPLGIEIIVLDAADCPAKQINQNAKHVTGSFKDPAKIRELAARCDVLTVEIEHINTEVLEEIATKGVLTGPGTWKKVPVHPSWETLRLIQDKFAQKEHFSKLGIPIAPQMAIESGEAMLDSLRATYEKFGFPYMLKSKKDSYDGRGNFKVDGPEDFQEAVKVMGKLPLYAEKFVPFTAELAVIVVRTENDEGDMTGIHTYPPVETVHEESICTKVYYPPRNLATNMGEKARKVAGDAISTLKGRGVFAVEMFVAKNGDIILNEVAPRCHNSGHATIESVPYMSQYKAQLYSILNILPRSIKLEPRVSSAIMLNILGGAEATSHDSLIDLTETLYDENLDIYLHLYGKASKPSRKIGHITVTTTSKDADLAKLALPLSKEVDRIRQARLEASSEQLRPTEPAAKVKKGSSRNRDAPLVVVTMGSDSDLGVLSGAFKVLEDFEVPYDYTITSAHRTPARMVELGKTAAARGIKVLIAGAGGAAHLPGMLASETSVPVIGVPVKATHLDGQDSLYSIVQMPRGCPVATVGINNSTNAALLAVKILGSYDAEYRDKMDKFMKNMETEVIQKAEKLQEIGFEAYLESKK